MFLNVMLHVMHRSVLTCICDALSSRRELLSEFRVTQEAAGWLVQMVRSLMHFTQVYTYCPDSLAKINPLIAPV